MRKKKKDPRALNCRQCKRLVYFDEPGWLINGSKEFLCGHKCFEARRLDGFWEALENEVRQSK